MGERLQITRFRKTNVRENKGSGASSPEAAIRLMFGAVKGRVINYEGMPGRGRGAGLKGPKREN